jgi:hypothetical protein
MGTNGYLNKLLFRKSKPELDVASYRDGTGFKVVGMLRRIEDAGNPRALDRGYLRLVPGEPVAWHGRIRAQVLIGPFELNETGGKILFGGNFAKCLLSSGKNEYELAVPKLDLALVRLALGIETA